MELFASQLPETSFAQLLERYELACFTVARLNIDVCIFGDCIVVVFVFLDCTVRLPLLFHTSIRWLMQKYNETVMVH